MGISFRPFPLGIQCSEDVGGQDCVLTDWLAAETAGDFAQPLGFFRLRAQFSDSCFLRPETLNFGDQLGNQRTRLGNELGIGLLVVQAGHTDGFSRRLRIVRNDAVSLFAAVLRDPRPVCHAFQCCFRALHNIPHCTASSRSAANRSQATALSRYSRQSSLARPFPRHIRRATSAARYTSSLASASVETLMSDMVVFPLGYSRGSEKSGGQIPRAIRRGVALSANLDISVPVDPGVPFVFWRGTRRPFVRVFGVCRFG
ncbi:hypothetical protein Henu3_gp108 [Mycobacterium phage Henu3 PeY-2017]|nr:hypothetical protein Henu3_gp108 [Mycobacterium phage Henu3 PeY-2017]